jgi:hypothetical protein
MSKFWGGSSSSESESDFSEEEVEETNAPQRSMFAGALSSRYIIS